MLTWYYLYIIPTPSPAEKKKLKGKQRSDKNNWNLDLRDKNSYKFVANSYTYKLSPADQDGTILC